MGKRNVHITRIPKRIYLNTLQSKIQGGLQKYPTQKPNFDEYTNSTTINLRTCKLVEKFQHSKMRNRQTNFLQLRKLTALIVSRLAWFI